MDENAKNDCEIKTNKREKDNLLDDLYENGKCAVIEAFNKMKDNLGKLEKETEELLKMKKDKDEEILALKKLKDEELLAIVREKDEEILAFKKVRDEEILAMKKENDREMKKFHDLTSLLRAKLECPVCLEVPSSGPIHTCPNGHIVCSKCKQNCCPICRDRMFLDKSLLAVAVIENIEHQCKLDGCNALLPLGDLENHMKTCLFRIISCPAPSEYCGKKVAFCQVLDHILTDCEGSTNKKEGGEIIMFEEMPQIWNYTSEDFPSEDFFMEGTAFQWKDKFFYMASDQANGASVFSLLHIGNGEDSGKFKVNIGVHTVDDDDMHGDYVHWFAGEALSIEVSEEERKKNGVSVGNFQLRKIARKEDELWKFSVTYNIKQ